MLERRYSFERPKEYTADEIDSAETCNIFKSRICIYFPSCPYSKLFPHATTLWSRSLAPRNSFDSCWFHRVRTRSPKSLSLTREAADGGAGTSVG